jgi:hypothetical protein
MVIGTPARETHDCPAPQFGDGAAPKLVPVILNPIWIGPSGSDMPVMLGPTVNFTPLLATPPTVTTTLPVVAVAGTLIVIEVEVQVGADPAEPPLNVTVLVP